MSRQRINTYPELGRPAHLFIAMADPLAGFIAASSSGVDIFRLPFVIGSSALICAGGSTLNDFSDRESDPPGRPIPSDRVSAGGALCLGAVLMVAGVLLASAAGFYPLLVSICLAAAVVSYNAGLKSSVFAAAVTMGTIRALNLSLGLAAGSPAPWLLVLPLIIFAFVFAAELLKRCSGKDARLPGKGVLSGWAGACAAVLYLIAGGFFVPGGLPFAAALYLVSGTAVMMAFSGRATAAASRALLFSIPLLDASFSAGAMGLMAGLPVAALALPAIVLSRRA